MKLKRGFVISIDGMPCLYKSTALKKFRDLNPNLKVSRLPVYYITEPRGFFELEGFKKSIEGKTKLDVLCRNLFNCILFLIRILVYDQYQSIKPCILVYDRYLDTSVVFNKLQLTMRNLTCQIWMLEMAKKYNYNGYISLIFIPHRRYSYTFYKNRLMKRDKQTWLYKNISSVGYLIDRFVESDLVMLHFCISKNIIDVLTRKRSDRLINNMYFHFVDFFCFELKKQINKVINYNLLYR